MRCQNCGHPKEAHHEVKGITGDCIARDGRGKNCPCIEYKAPPDVLFSDLSEPEKAAVEHFWTNYPEKREASGDPNNPTLGEIERSIAQNVGKPADFTFGDPIKRCDQTQYIAFDKDFPFQNLYCANCGTELKKLEDDNFEMVCDCGINGTKYDFDLITFDPNEHLRRNKLKDKE